MYKSEEVIECMIENLCPHSSERDRHVLRQTLQGLVRLAKAESTLDIQRDLESINEVMMNATRRRLG